MLDVPCVNTGIGSIREHFTITGHVNVIIADSGRLTVEFICFFK